jgi:hypothetical protein
MHLTCSVTLLVLAEAVEIELDNKKTLAANTVELL